MKKNVLQEKSLELASLGIEISIILQEKREYSFADQIKRSATSVGANIAEASHPQSRADMISKFEIALKEAFEVDHWLKVFKQANLIEESIFESTNKICTKIRVLLISSIKTLKTK